MIKKRYSKKKFRGLSRYFRNLHKENYDDYVNWNSWFHLWHDHPDNYGLGKISWKSRKQHLDATFIRADYIIDRLSKRKEPFQFFIDIYEKDGYNDSIYIHTKTPYNNIFPLQETSNYDGTIYNNNRVYDYIKDKGYNILINNVKYENEYGILVDDICYMLYKENFGLSIVNKNK